MIATLLLLAARQEAPAVSRIDRPVDGAIVDVEVGPDGTVHAACGRNDRVTYSTSTDDGATWSGETRIDGDHECAAAMERGPRIAVGRDGWVHVAWMGGRGSGSWYARGQNGQFQEPINVLDSDTPVDGTTVAADAEGRVWVLWLDSREGPDDSDNPIGSPLYMARSEDDGSTFPRNERVAMSYNGRGCACCMLDACVGGDGRLRIAFRGAFRGQRDVIFARGDADGRRFEAAPMANDQWVLRACPMDGPSVFAGRDDRPTTAVAWRVRDEIKLGFVDGRGRVAGAVSLGSGSRWQYPVALLNGDGFACVAWCAGSDLRFAVYDSRGRQVAADSLGEVNADMNPVGFVARDGSFRIVY